MGWRAYVAKRALLNALPFGDALRALKRRVSGYAPDPQNLIGTLEGLEWMLAELDRSGRSLTGRRILEVGSGWFPTIPIMLCVQTQVAHVHMTDLNRHMDEITFGQTLAFLKGRVAGNEALRKVVRMSDLPLTYLAPFRVEDVPDGSIDAIMSRTVLEHIEPEALVKLLAELRRKLSPDGVMVHLVDHSDHLWHRDRSISMVNFLQWSPRFHRAVNWLTREGENRLRHHQYPALFEAAGYRVESFSNRVHEPTLKVLGSLRLAAPYDTMAPEDVAVDATVYVVSPR